MTFRPEAPPDRGGTGRRAVAVVVAAVLAVAVAFAAGWLTAPRTATPSDGSVEAGFARDMQQHHDQAVEMAMLVRTRTSDPEVSRLAYDIATSQAQQSGQMYAWLNLWGLPQASSRPVMAWMSQPPLSGAGSGSHDHPGSTTASATGMPPGDPMPGMATAPDISRLSQLSGVEAEKLFLNLMIAHHLGGVAMAQAVIARTENPLVLALANSMTFAQTSEIASMRALLASRGA